MNIIDEEINQDNENKNQILIEEEEEDEIEIDDEQIDEFDYENMIMDDKIIEKEEQELIEEVEEKIIQEKKQIIKKPSKPNTPYLIFLKMHKESHNNLNFKDLSKLWGELEASEKRIYQEKAEEDKQRFAKEMEEYLEYVNNNPQVNLQETDKICEEIGLFFPVSRVKSILKVDPDSKIIKKDYLMYLSKSLEYFTEFLVRDSVKICQLNKRKKLIKNDFYQVIKNNSNLKFLHSIINNKILEQKSNYSYQQSKETNQNQNINQIQVNNNVNNKLPSQKQSQSIKQKSLINNKKINDFFK